MSHTLQGDSITPLLKSVFCVSSVFCVFCSRIFWKWQDLRDGQDAKKLVAVGISVLAFSPGAKRPFRNLAVSDGILWYALTFCRYAIYGFGIRLPGWAVFFLMTARSGSYGVVFLLCPWYLWLVRAIP